MLFIPCAGESTDPAHLLRTTAHLLTCYNDKRAVSPVRRPNFVTRKHTGRQPFAAGVGLGNDRQPFAKSSPITPPHFLVRR